MKRIFITGMSGTGKSTVIAALRSGGFTAIDTDYDDWCETAVIHGDSDLIWREDRMHDLLTNPLESPLFVAGCYSNQGKFYTFFDYKILFSAPLDVILDRVAKRTSNPYGKSEQEQADIIHNFEHIQPLLRQSADVELDTSRMSVSEISNYLIDLSHPDKL